jgi:hypothetical protein
MKYINLSTVIACCLTVNATVAQNPANWTAEQLMEPAQLAQILTAGGKLPLLISVGPGATIPHSVAIGQAKDQENLDKLSTLLKTVKKRETIVLYCGCCPFENCPNVRPAIALIKEKGSRNYKLLNIPHNIKKDWIDKGYPKADL